MGDARMTVMCDCFGVRKQLGMPNKPAWRGKHKLAPDLFVVALYKSPKNGRCFLEYLEHGYEKTFSRFEEIYPETFPTWYEKLTGVVPEIKEKKK